MDSFQSRLKVKTIKADLQALPRGLDAYDTAYDDAMARIFGQERDYHEAASRILSLVLCATRPLATTELQHALMVEPGDTELDQDNSFEAQDILAVCAGLIAIDESSATIRFVHYTTQEYLQRTRERWLPRAQFEIARTCLDYLSLRDFALLRASDMENQRPIYDKGSPDATCSKFAFASYALSEGLAHLNAAVQSEGSLRDDLLLLPKSPGILFALWKFLEYAHLGAVMGPPPHLYTFVHLVSHLGLASLVSFYIDNGSPADLRDGIDRTPLSYAAEAGRLSVVQLLLEHGAIVDSKDIFGRTPLLYAAIAGHSSVVRSLLDHKSSADSEVPGGWSPLSYAVRRCDEDILQSLLQHGAIVDFKNGSGRTPLSYAAQTGCLSIVQLLLSKGADPMMMDHENVSPVWYALGSNHIDVFRLLRSATMKPIDDFTLAVTP